MKLAMIAASLILAGSAQAQSIKEKYEPSERCGKQAAEFFTKRGKGAEVRSSFQNHYNSRLNKCFVLVEDDNQIQMQGVSSFKAIALIDLNENKIIASYSKFESLPRGLCLGEGAQENSWCETEKEWRALIKLYMED